MINSNILLKKMRSNIEGLDRLLYGGIDINNRFHVIVVRGGHDGDRSMLGVQILYGVAQSLGAILNEESKEDISTCYYSTYLDEAFMNDMLLDIYISSCISQLMTMYVNVKEENRDSISNIMSKIFFNIEDIQQEGAYKEIVRNRILNLVKYRTDYLLGKETLYYNTRTNCVHFRSAKRVEDRDSDSDGNNLVFRRKGNSVEEVFEETNKEDLDELNRFFCKPFERISFRNSNIETISEHLSNVRSGFRLIGIDVEESLDHLHYFNVFKEIINNQKESLLSDGSGSTVLLLNVPLNERIPLDYVDMVIDLTAEQEENLTYKYLSIVKSRKQGTILGKHQYKKRDYGLEIYPNVLTYFERRRYLQRALVYTHSNVLRDTYQQYIDSKQNLTNEKKGYKDYMANRERNEEQRFQSLFPNYDIGLSSVDILDTIMLSQTSLYKQEQPTKDASHSVGSSTAIIGNPNTFKRYITFGSIFSSAKNQEHTLLLLLHKDDVAMRRRLVCPARSEREKMSKRCQKCYNYIHFMNICTGNITPDEFVYYLVQQLDTRYQDGKLINRLVIDDMQILDYCFPMLVKRRMFIETIVSVCKERGIHLYFLCDKHCSLVKELRAVADNIVCTDRSKDDGKLNIYIERFIGFQDTPSKVYHCNVKKVQHLFDCYERKDDDDNSVSYFELNSKYINSKSISSLDAFWRE